MGIVKRAADLAYTIRFVTLMATPFESMDAYKLGLIDKEGKRVKSERLDTDEKKSAYTPFIRLAVNLKRLVSNVPGGGTRLGSLASALYLIKENYKLQDKNLTKILDKFNVEPLDFIAEKSEWFITNDDMLSPGIYRVNSHKMINSTYDMMVLPKDMIRIHEDCYPVGDVFGINIYKATHTPTNQPIFITATEIYK
jgi:hypothetical protein